MLTLWHERPDWSKQLLLAALCFVATHDGCHMDFLYLYLGTWFPGFCQSDELMDVSCFWPSLTKLVWGWMKVSFSLKAVVSNCIPCGLCTLLITQIRCVHPIRRWNIPDPGNRQGKGRVSWKTWDSWDVSPTHKPASDKVKTIVAQILVFWTWVRVKTDFRAGQNGPFC